MAVARELDDPSASPERTDSRLTAQEQQILALAATGWSTKAVAEALGLAPESIRRSLASIMRRVGAHSKIEAVMIAVRNRLIDLPTETHPQGTPSNVYRASAVRPVVRLRNWDAAGRRDAHAPPAHADTRRRMTEPGRDQIADVDGAAT